MGYNTEYVGILKFGRELTASELAILKSYFGEDCRDHKEWGEEIENYYVNLEFTDDYSGLQWDGMEKTYNMPEIIEFIIKMAKKSIPDFELTGYFNCQGEDIDDRYRIVMEKNIPKVIKDPPVGEKITCPHCEEEFYYNPK